MTSTIGYEFHSDWLREAAAKGRAEGIAEGIAEGRAQGEGRSVLTVLDARGVHVPEAVREQILACTDLTQLDTWLRRAATATTADDIIRP